MSRDHDRRVIDEAVELELRDRAEMLIDSGLQDIYLSWRSQEKGDPYYDRVDAIGFGKLLAACYYVLTDHDRIRLQVSGGGSAVDWADWLRDGLVESARLRQRALSGQPI